MSLKEIQEWLGHSDFAITANIYAHLEFDSKQKSAEKMSWIGSTSLALEVVMTPTAEKENTDDGSIHALPDFMHSLIVSGVPLELIQSWLKQVDFTSEKSLADSFNEFQSAVKA